MYATPEIDTPGVVRPALAGAFACVAALIALATVPVAAAPVASTQVLTLDGARAVAAAAASEARRLGSGGAIAVVDTGGQLLYLERIDGTFAAAAAVAIEKARTAAQFQRPTRVFEEAIRSGRTSLVAVDVMTPLQGGVPIVAGDQVVGAIGVSGAASAQQDDELAVFGAGALERGVASQLSDAPPVTYLDAKQVKSGFQHGAVLVDHGSYMVHASHREGPGEAEVHMTDTDIIYVLDGSATLVTGGSVEDERQIAPGEVRGARIVGGDARRLAPGDVIVVANGIPHWFQQVKGPFNYYVVKVRQPIGGVL